MQSWISKHHLFQTRHNVKSQRRRLQLMSIKILPIFNQMLLEIVVCITAVLLRQVWSVKNYLENSRRCWLIQVCEKDAFVVVVIRCGWDSNSMWYWYLICPLEGMQCLIPSSLSLSLSIIIHHSHIFPSHKSFVSLSPPLHSYSPHGIELSSVITWMPHGRSFKVIDRETFVNHALVRYFGHSNFASYIRIVNAWYVMICLI